MTNPGSFSARITSISSEKVTRSATGSTPGTGLPTLNAPSERGNAETLFPRSASQAIKCAPTPAWRRYLLPMSFSTLCKRRQRKIGHQFEPLWQLEPGELERFKMRDQLSEVERLTLHLESRRRTSFHPVRGRHGDAGDVLDRVCVRIRLFDFLRRNFFAATVDKIFLSASTR